MVNGEHQSKHQSKTKQSWLVVPSTTFSIDQSQSTGFSEEIRGFWHGEGTRAAKIKIPLLLNTLRLRGLEKALAQYFYLIIAT